jgi:Ca-activated chloride channel family protein
MERARLKIADLAKAREGQPLGLVAYAGSAHLVLPPTIDTSVVAEMAAEISPDIMPRPGDRLDLAIGKASEVLAGEQSGGTLLVVADSVQGDSQSIVEAHGESGSFPIQFLALRQDGSLTSTARLLHASVETLTPDDEDIVKISKAAERKAVIGIAGKSSRWQEAGYWLTPLLALMVAASFRRRRQRTAGGEL